MPKRTTPGNLLIEVLVATSIGVAFALTITTLVSANSRLVTSTRHQTQAVAYAKEGMERIYAMKDADFQSVATVETGYAQILQQGNTFVLLPDVNDPPGEALPESMRRTVQVSIGKRDAGGKLAEEGIEDPDVRFVRVTVYYNDRESERSVTLSGYITKWK